MTVVELAGALAHDQPDLARDLRAVLEDELGPAERLEEGGWLDPGSEDQPRYDRLGDLKRALDAEIR